MLPNFTFQVVCFQDRGVPAKTSGCPLKDKARNTSVTARLLFLACVLEAASCRGEIAPFFEGIVKTKPKEKKKKLSA